MSTTLKLSASALEKICKSSQLQKDLENRRAQQKKEKKKKLDSQALEKKKRYKEIVQKCRNVMEWLCEQYPLCFKKDDVPVPLKVGIIKDIFAVIPENAVFSRGDVRRTLLRYAHRTVYLQSLISSAHRYDLAGNQVGEVSEDNKVSARLKLDKILVEKFKNRSAV
ncbi:hypothetical protein FACS189449_02160 [Alphaproteobacteria bacterium]|nr:hypothetical protein FACS189449_02160 [Alphaproteobacteria bacterium]